MNSPSEDAKGWDTLMQFLASEEPRSTSEIEAGLRAQGVQLDKFLSRTGETIRKAIQSEWRSQATTERRVAETTAEQTRKQVHALSTEEVRALVARAVAGSYGSAGRELAIACRNEQLGTTSETDLRSLAEDILSVANVKPQDPV